MNKRYYGVENGSLAFKLSYISKHKLKQQKVDFNALVLYFIIIRMIEVDMHILVDLMIEN